MISGGGGISNIGLEVGWWPALVVGIDFIPKIVLLGDMTKLCTNLALRLGIVLVICFGTIEGGSRTLVLVELLLHSGWIIGRSWWVWVENWRVGGSGLVIVIGAGLIRGSWCWSGSDSWYWIGSGKVV